MGFEEDKNRLRSKNSGRNETVKINENIKFSEMVDGSNINFHPKEFSILSRRRSPRDEILNSKG